MRFVSRFAAVAAMSILPQVGAAFEFEAGQRFCVSDNSLACGAVWEVETLDEGKDEIVIRLLRLVNLHQNKDLPVEKWATARDKEEFLFESASKFRFAPPNETNKYRADPIRICETDLLRFSMDGVDTVNVKRDDGTTIAQRIVDGMRADHLEKEYCYEISTCSQKVGFVRHERILMKVFSKGEEQPNSASFLRELGWLERSKGVLVPSHLLLGNVYSDPAKCG